MSAEGAYKIDNIDYRNGSNNILVKATATADTLTFVGDSSASIIESINKIGSLLNDSIQATFLLAILTKRANGYGAVSGIIVGFLINLMLWIYFPEISWMWSNAIGCLVSFSIGYTVSTIFKVEQD